jgi:hypothetical protein
MESLIDVDVFSNCGVKLARNLQATTKNSRQNISQGMSLEERRHKDVQGSMFQVQRFNSFRPLNIEL